MAFFFTNFLVFLLYFSSCPSSIFPFLSFLISLCQFVLFFPFFFSPLHISLYQRVTLLSLSFLCFVNVYHYICLSLSLGLSYVSPGWIRRRLTLASHYHYLRLRLCLSLSLSLSRLMKVLLQSPLSFSLSLSFTRGGLFCRRGEASISTVFVIIISSLIILSLSFSLSLQ